MRARRSGKIVNISSISGKIGGAASRVAGAESGRSGPAYQTAEKLFPEITLRASMGLRPEDRGNPKIDGELDG
jgi:hypothetical protein